MQKQTTWKSTMTAHVFLLPVLFLPQLILARTSLQAGNPVEHDSSVLSDANTNISETSDGTKEHSAVIYHGNRSSETALQTVSPIHLVFPHMDENSSIKNTCSHPWFYLTNSSNGSTVCECGSELGLTVHCSSETQQVEVLICYCMTYNKESASFVVGMCIYSCFFGNTYYPIPNHVNANTTTCSDDRVQFHRDGQLCGECEVGYAPPVYSYSLACVECSKYTTNWIKYVGVAFLPLTLFFGITVVFRLSVTSGLLNGFVFVAQILSVPAQSRVITTLLPAMDATETEVLLVKILLSFFSCWNLDFFRMVYTPFCLHPSITTIQALALDYIIAVYPLVLLLMVYIFVELQDHGCRVIMWLWKPFHYCFSHFRRQWDIRTSLVDAFATFLFLSYVKVLSVSTDLLVPTTVYDIHGKPLPNLYLYYDGTTEYFGKDHHLLGITAILVVLIFVPLPLLLLCLYPCQCSQGVLNKLRLRCGTLHIFMDSIQGCYKDGTNGTRDCRYFAGLQLLVQIAIMGVYIFTRTDFYYPLATVVLAAFTITLIIFQPYKSAVHNIINSIHILSMIIGYSSAAACIISSAQTVTTTFRATSLVMISLSFLVPLFYIPGVVLYWFIARKKVPQKLFYKLMHRQTRELEGSLPERVVHAEANAALIPAPMSNDVHCSDD